MPVGAKSRFSCESVERGWARSGVGGGGDKYVPRPAPPRADVGAGAVGACPHRRGPRPTEATTAVQIHDTQMIRRSCATRATAPLDSGVIRAVWTSGRRPGVIRACAGVVWCDPGVVREWSGTCRRSPGVIRGAYGSSRQVAGSQRARSGSDPACVDRRRERFVGQTGLIGRHPGVIGLGARSSEVIRQRRRRSDRCNADSVGSLADALPAIPRVQAIAHRSTRPPKARLRALEVCLRFDRDC